VAEFAARGLDDPMLSRAYPVIREAIRRWAAMGEVWQDYDHPESLTVVAPMTADWYDPKELWPTG
jgi:hypothetical protein